MKSSERERTLRALERAAMQWYKWLIIGGRGADYHAYYRAFVTLERACARHAAARKKERK